MAQKIVIKKSEIEGSGVFARQAITKGETIFILKGSLVHWIVKDQKTSLAGPNWVGIGKDTWLDVRSPGVYLNHSCKPNSGIRGSRLVTALRPIKKGEEILIDYSITEEDNLWHMQCRCGNKECRKIIKSIQSLPQRTFEKYLPFIPMYFKNKYMRYNKNNA